MSTIEILYYQLTHLARYVNADIKKTGVVYVQMLAQLVVMSILKEHARTMDCVG